MRQQSRARPSKIPFRRAPQPGSHPPNVIIRAASPSRLKYEPSAVPSIGYTESDLRYLHAVS